MSGIVLVGLKTVTISHNVISASVMAISLMNVNRRVIPASSVLVPMIPDAVLTCRGFVVLTA